MTQPSSRLTFGIILTLLSNLVNYGITNAQIIPDHSLGAESSKTRSDTIKNTPSDVIEGGATRGSNLFHSFREFNVNEGRGAYFANPDVIQNIFSRVTGGNISQIMGTLGVLGNANLFLINPSGIIFGPNARLDLRGAFIGVTADSVVFDNNFEFSATNPNAPPLLTVNIPLGLRFRETSGNIENNSTAPTGFSSPSGISISGLRVPDGQSLLLVGGDISMDGGRLNALGGRVELGGLAGVGIVGLQIDGNIFSLSFTPESLRSDVTLANDARVSVRGSGGGDIVVNANTFTAINGGRLVAGTEGLANGSDITVNANNFNISGLGVSELEAGLYNQTFANAEGNAGNILVNTKSFSASSGASLINTVLAESRGNGGDIIIRTGSLSLSDGAQLNASTFGVGNAGSILVQADGSVVLVNSNIFNNVGSGAVGNAGGIFITAQSLFLTQGSQLQSGIRGASDTLMGGRGNGGNVSIDVRDTLSLTGVDNNGFSSAIYTDVEVGAVGNGGNIKLKAGMLSLADDAQLNAITSGEGNAGNIEISTGSLSLVGGARVSASTFSRGNAGAIRITVSETISITDEDSEGDASGIFSSVAKSTAEGNSGGIEISTGSLSC